MKFKKDGFQGIWEVFRFTFSQAVKKKGFYLVTILVTILLFAGIIVTQFVMDSKKIKSEVTGEEITSSVKTLYVKNETDIQGIDFSLLAEFDEIYKDLQIEETNEDSKAFGKRMAEEEKTDSLLLQIRYKFDDHYKLDETAESMATRENHGGITAIQLVAYLPDNSDISKGEASDLLDCLNPVIEQYKLMNSGVSAEILALATAPVNYDVTKAGEEAEGMELMLVKMLGPMLAGLAIYFLILVYGQSISKEIIAEKTSKIMETLLLSVEPYGIIGGKILAMVSVALFQIALWICGGVLGYITGEAILSNILPKKEHTLHMLLVSLKDIVEGAAFSVPAVILAVLSLIVGFVLYCVLAGLVSSKVSKAEDLSQGMMVFQIVVVVCFLVTYLIPAMQTSMAENIAKVLRYIPFTAAFMIPADVLVGNISLAGSIISIILMMAVGVLIVIWMGKIYKDSVFYNGKK